MYQPVQLFTISLKIVFRASEMLHRLGGEAYSAAVGFDVIH